jgi:hypothetical protein
LLLEWKEENKRKMFLLLVGKVREENVETRGRGKWGMWPVVKYKGKEKRESCEMRAEIVLLEGKRRKRMWRP